MSSFDSQPPSDPSEAESQPLPTGRTRSAGQTAGEAETNPPAEESLPANSPFAWRWLDLAVLLAFYVVAALVLLAALAILGVTPQALRGPTSNQVALVVAGQALHSGAVLAFLYLMVRSRSPVAFWPALGWHALPAAGSRTAMVARYALTGAVLLVGIQIASNYLGAEPRTPMDEMFRNRSSVLLMMTLAILVAPLVEETLFRGCLYQVIARTFGMPAGIAATGALFGLFHALQLGGSWKPVGLLIVVGMVLTYIRARSGTVAASYLVHLSYNTTLFILFFVGTNGLRNFPVR